MTSPLNLPALRALHADGQAARHDDDMGRVALRAHARFASALMEAWPALLSAAEDRERYRAALAALGNAKIRHGGITTSAPGFDRALAEVLMLADRIAVIDAEKGDDHG